MLLVAVLVSISVLVLVAVWVLVSGLVLVVGLGLVLSSDSDSVLACGSLASSLPRVSL